MLKQIRIELSCGTTLAEHTFGHPDEITFSYMDADKKAEISDETEKSRKIDREIFLSVWNEIIKINFTKLLQENEKRMGYDGYEQTVHINLGLSEVSVVLWCPDEAEYAKTGCTESAAFMHCINSILKIRKCNRKLN